MCILLNVKKHEKTFALNVDIFSFDKKTYNMLTNKNTDDKLLGGALCFVVLFF